MIVLKPEEMKAVDQTAIKAGFPELLLMETAGRGVAEESRRLLESEERAILIFAGKGNNGGDGLVAARILDMWGYQVEVILLSMISELEGSSRVNFQLCQERKIEVLELPKMNDNVQSLKGKIQKTDLIIDAMLGTGIKGKVREPIITIVDLINNSRKKILAVDIPSGIDGDSGAILGKAIWADLTVTMAYPKLGLVLYPGRAFTGELTIIDLGVPDSYTTRLDVQHYVLTENEAGRLLPHRPLTGHKGTFGKVGILGGSSGMAGAPAMSGQAALKCGAGLVKVAVPAAVHSAVASYSPELLTVGLQGIEELLRVEDLAEVNKLKEFVDVLAVGPGMGRSRAATKVVYNLIRELAKPLVIDADGINAIDDLEIMQERNEPLILTPHPGEMARLIDKSIGEIEQDRIGVARNFATRYNTYLILKGASTIIALPDGRVFINPTGNEGMATAGSGDVLTGIICGLLAQGMKVEKAAVLAPYLHGLAGELAGNELTTYGVTAGDIIRYIPAAIKRLY